MENLKIANWKIRINRMNLFIAKSLMDKVNGLVMVSPAISGKSWSAGQCTHFPDTSGLSVTIPLTEKHSLRKAFLIAE